MTRQEQILCQKYLDFASEAFQKLFATKSIIAQHKVVKGLHVSLLICGDSKIKKLNSDHRAKNKITDVLSFPAHEDLRKVKNLPFAQGQLFLGDMAICHPQVKRQAKKYKVGYADEFIHLVTHGVLHLLGYDHEVSSKEEKEMQEFEDWILSEMTKIKSKEKGP